jgi:hypothetical protein
MPSDDELGVVRYTVPSHYGPWRQGAFHAGFSAGHRTALEYAQAAVDRARVEFERTLAVLREENSTLRRMLEASALRADSLTTEVARSLVVQPTPGPTPPPAALVGLRKPTGRDPIQGLGNVLDPVPIGDPHGEFSSLRAASLMMAEEEANHAASTG